jgi:DUF4097 and DUF4098 domain-containing protein YvlB
MSGFQSEENMKSYRVWAVGVAALSILAWVAPAAAESRIEKSLDLQPGGQFILESDSGSVTVTGASRSGAHIVLTSDKDDLSKELELTFTSNAGIAHVTARRTHDSFFSHGVSAHFEIEVPTETRTEIHTGGGAISISGLRGQSEVKTSGGPIEVMGLNGHLEAYTSGGPVHIREVTGDATIGTSGGPIDVEELEGTLKAHTSGGGIHINRVSGYVEAKTSGGPIHAVYSPGNLHGGDLDTSGGSIEVSIDRSANLSLDAETSGGSVHSDLPVRMVGTISPTHVQGSIGSGGEELRLHTSGGSIHIHAL